MIANAKTKTSDGKPPEVFLYAPPDTSDFDFFAVYCFNKEVDGKENIMKEQYFGDIGDYGKYGLLRFLAKKGIKIGVHWYMTKNPPGSNKKTNNDGKFTDYLDSAKNKKAAEEMKVFDPDLYEVLHEMVIKNKTRDTAAFEQKNMIPNAVYYREEVPQNINGARGKWHEKALAFFRDRDLVFMDPDNGLISKQRRHKDKFCFPNEAADFYNAGKNVVYYCSKGRRSNEAWEEYKNVMKKEYLPDAEIIAITYHKGTQRSYVFVLHPASKEKFDEALKVFSENWQDVFTRE